MVFLLSLMAGFSEAGAISFSLEELATSSDFAEVFETYKPSLLENPSRYKLSSNTYLIQQINLPLANKEPFKVMLVGTGSKKSSWYTDIQLLLVEEKNGAISIPQRFKLGAGEWPHMLTPSDVLPSDEFMVQVMRRGNNVEAYVYSADSLTGKLTQTFHVDRSFLSKMKLVVRGELLPGGFIELSAQNPDKKETLDMSGALDALIEDEVYQLNARPIPSLRNLSAVRMGSEGVEIHRTDNAPELRVGLSLVTLSKKRVVDATAVLARNANNQWIVKDVLFEPFLPYREQ